MAELKFKLGEGDEDHPYTVRFEETIYSYPYDISTWCTETFNTGNFNKERCTFTTHWIWFKHQADRDWFVLRWSS